MARQAGMTLIELTVVLLVLIGLAGLMIPYVSGFVGKTHDSTGTSNAARAGQAIVQYDVQFMGQPNNMESLLNATAGTRTDGADTICEAAVAFDPYCKMMAPAFYSKLTLNAAHVTSLNNAGITSVLDNNPDTTDATFKSVAAARTFAAAEFLAGVSAAPSTGIATVPEHLVEAFGGQVADYDTACYDYATFGIGDGNTMIGRTMQSAPIHFANQAAMGPTSKYNRFVAVYKVQKSMALPCGDGTMTSIKPAKFIGTAMSMGAMSGHLWGVGASASHAYSNIAAETAN